MPNSSTNKDSLDASDTALAYLILVSAIGFFVLDFYFAISLEKLFGAAKSDLPMPARLVIDTYRYWVTIVAVGFAGFVLVVWGKNTGGWVLLVGSAAFLFVLIPLTLFMNYLSLAALTYAI